MMFHWIRATDLGVQVLHGGGDLGGSGQNARHVGRALENVAALPEAALVDGRLQTV